ncbi:FH2-domain-containing protein [Coprinopsis marcescibilis]|uniref:FH2-domain-containing protein n=1 Tax=Coprinopsis marcescibilis TaxID=230819 RepID=A0A5C3L833_COPMA|nr:FH2-domain-containing protein [Coprinopsis marcescibilis]
MPGFKLPGKLKATRPAKRLKPFFWNKLSTPTYDTTVWRDLSNDAQFDLSDLESTFVVDNTPATPSQILSPKKQNVTTVLDITRANNVAIMLSRIKMGLAAICNAILEMDDSALSVDDLKAIGKQLPTNEEIERIKNFGNVDKLSKSDQYFSHIMSIPRLSERLECMAYRRKVDLDIEEIRPDLNTLRNASRELRASSKFKTVLQVVLMIGNSLNGNTFRGNARGFQIDSLLKLKETKTVNGGLYCKTLLHYLAKVLLRKDPSITTFIEDLPSLEAASRISVQTTLQSVTSLVAGLNLAKSELEEYRKVKAPANDRFSSVMEKFIAEADTTVDALKNMGNSVDGELKALLEYYGEDPNAPEAPKPEDFFGIIASFSSSLQKCALEVHDAEMKLAKDIPVVVVDKAEEEKRGTVKQPYNAGVHPPSSYSQASSRDKLSVGRGDLDQAIRSMREGKRIARPTRPLSKIFIDGSSYGRRQSRGFET